jgi:hypothetical protein
MSKNKKTRNAGQRPRQQQSTKQGGQAQNRSVRAPVAIGNISRQAAPKVRSVGESIFVKHTEYVQDILSTTTAFQVQSSIPMNPGMRQAFPWLYQIASRYESYRFKKLHYRFDTDRPSTETGFIVLSPDYDPSDVQPQSKQQAMQYQSMVKVVPWVNALQVNTTANLSKRKSYFVREGIPPTGQDLQLFDTGNLFVCVGGNTGGANVLGELWCDYEVELMTPKLDSPSAESAKLTGVGVSVAVGPFGVTPTIAFARSPFFLATSIAGVGIITFLQDYQGLIVMQLAGTGLAAVALGGTAAGNGGSIFNSVSTNSMSYFYVSATRLQTITITPTATTLTGSDLRIGEYAFSLQ